jgi:hypothetical protein
VGFVARRMRQRGKDGLLPRALYCARARKQGRMAQCGAKNGPVAPASTPLSDGS